MVETIFKYAAFVHKYKIHRFFLFPTLIIHILGVFIGYTVFNNAQLNQRFYKSFQYIYPEMTKMKLKKKVRQLRNNLSRLFVIIMIDFPNMGSNNLHKYIQFKGIHHLNEGLQKGKGVILCSLHTGNVFHILAGLIYHPNEYEIVGIGNLSNRKLFGNILLQKREILSRLYIIGSDKYGSIKEKIEDHVQKNRIIFLMQDFTNKDQLRIPILDYSPPAPQSAVALHLKYGSTIIPCMIHPNRGMRKSVVEFFDPIDSEDLLKKYPSEDEKKWVYGELSRRINFVLFDYIRKYAQYYTELPMFGRRVMEGIIFEKDTTLSNYLDQVRERMIYIIENGYSPKISKKTQDKLLKLIDTSFNSVYNESNINSEKKIFHKQLFLNLSGQNLEKKLTSFIEISIRVLKIYHKNQNYNEFDDLQTVILKL